MDMSRFAIDASRSRVTSGHNLVLKFPSIWLSSPSGIRSTAAVKDLFSLSDEQRLGSQLPHSQSTST